MSNLERSASLPARMDEFEVENRRPAVPLVRSMSMSIAEGRSSRSSSKSFPPPLGCLARKSTGHCLNQVPWIRLQTIRSQGRIVLQEVNRIENQMSMHSVRKEGRLVLNLVRRQRDDHENSPVSKSSPKSPLSPPPSLAPSLPDSPVSEPDRAHASPSAIDLGDKTEEEVIRFKAAKAEAEEMKLRADHAHVLQELMENWRARLNQPCKRDEFEDHIWEQRHLIHCVTTSS